LQQEYLSGNLNKLNYPKKEPLTNTMSKSCLLHVLKGGTGEERQQILSVIKTKFIVSNKEINLK
jgi:hypothetical protein